MSNDPANPPAETPRCEPEIIPPSRDGSERFMEGGGGVGWESGDFQLHVARIGPFRLFVWAFVVILVAAALLLLFAGALLVAIPVIAILIVGSIIVARLRGAFRR